MTQPMAPPDLPLVEQLVASVGLPDVQELLQARRLTAAEHGNQVTELLTSTAREVAANVTNPDVAGAFGLARWAVLLGAASYVEQALFPEQQTAGDSGSEAYYRRFQGVLVRLRELTGTGSGVAQTADIAGSFSTAAFPSRALDTPAWR